MQLVNDLLGLIRLWWQKDRVRTSPRDGRLLRLEPGTLLTLGEETVEVLERGVIDTVHGPVVRYSCQGIDTSTTLWVTMSPVPITVYERGEGAVEFACDEIEVWNAGHHGQSAR